ncbi:methyltransferase domain-containing protein [Sphaerisporangium album]|uniref:methyltransferase domain-containing protein n=1 Tax=Sphaerisporangium album TaxID=509200 RepID=UPI0011C03EFC|nr:methyltransferase domain-containing protein [Sphaerisporangium album]
MGADDARGFISLDELIRPRTVAEPDACGCAPESADQAAGCCAPTPAAAFVPVETHVKQRYDALAVQGASTLCCSPTSVYTPEELAAVPEWVLELSSGCGSPMNAIALRPGQTVVDFGCGAGLDLLIAARRVGETGRVIGVDASMQMVRTARRAAREMGLSNVDVRVGDIRRPPVREATVDVVMSNCVLGMFPDKQEVLRAVAGVLRPGGVAVISDVVYSDGGPPPPDVAVGESAGAEDFARCVVGMTESQYRDLVLGAGFGRVEMRSDGLVPYRDGAEVTSAMIFAYRDDSPAQPCC